MLIATDEDLDLITPGELVELMAETFRLHHAGGLEAPARLRAELPNLGDKRMVFTVGSTSSMLGFRLYTMGQGPLIDQLTAIYDPSTGHLTGLVTGFQLGARRTGSLGAVAADRLARPDASVFGLIGTGGQAFPHLWAVNAVRPLRQVRVFSRTVSRREDFARRVEGELGIPCEAVAEPQAAVEGADLVTLATTSPTPVIDAAWIAAGTHVATLGPKAAAAHEAPIELAERADLLVTDSLAQIAGFGEPSWLTLSPGQFERVVPLGPIVAGEATGRTSADQITLFCSVGLAGTELVLAEEVLRRKRAAAV